jgi:hypothetical protein
VKQAMGLRAYYLRPGKRAEYIKTLEAARFAEQSAQDSVQPKLTNPTSKTAVGNSSAKVNGASKVTPAKPSSPNSTNTKTVSTITVPTAGDQSKTMSTKLSGISAVSAAYDKQAVIAPS